MEAPRAVVLDGRATAKAVREELAGRCAALAERGAPQPRLVVVQVGSRPDSSVYVRMKQRAAEGAGMRCDAVVLDEPPRTNCSK